MPQKRKRAVNPRMNVHFGERFERLIKLRGALRVLVGGLTCSNCTYGAKGLQDVLSRERSGGE